MESLLPSEIARLVLGYLEEQKCTEAAKLFLETSPHLQECRTVLSNGRRFSTRVSGLTLMDIVEKFSAVSAMIQERLNKVSDCDHLKHCGDLLEQLRFLVEETRGQRFVVNINVPSQANSQASSPIVSGSIRKRKHSNSDREKCKRIAKIIDVSQSQRCESVSTQSSCQNVEATPLESLPGHADLSRDEGTQTETVSHVQTQWNLRSENKNSDDCSSENLDAVTQSTDPPDIRESDSKLKRKETEEACNTEKCTAATSTEELLSFSNTEVQTTPYEVPESETESNDEPIENLSLLTKELLNRTELQEKIAENINKAMLPTELSLREETLNESMGGEINTSIMTELNNAIKSIVEATESDPVFEKFLDEMIGPHTETDTSPDEDSEAKPSPKPISKEKLSDTNVNSPEPPPPILSAIAEKSQENDAEVPLKHRLRSSSRQQNLRTEDEMEKQQKELEKEQNNVLEDQNAAAIMSIINANMNSDKKLEEEKKEEPKELATNVDNKPEAAAEKPQVVQENGVPENKSKKAPVKKPKPTKPKKEPENGFISEQELVTMPTLIVCSKQDINNFLTVNPPFPAGNVRPISSTGTSHFIPIAPKEPNKIREPVETVFLRTVNVARRVNPISLPKEPTRNDDVQKRTKVTKTLKAQEPQKVEEIKIVPTTEPAANKVSAPESITLYNNENSAGTLVDGTSMPVINLEENVSLSGAGLSPYLKFNCSKAQNHNLSDIDLGSLEEIKTQEKPEATTSKNCDVISKRTPRSLLKSRSKNHRLSLSTPRRKSSHIRALDFNTPKKVINSAKKVEKESVRVKPVCKTSLFKSPPFSNPQKVSPIKICTISASSPLPKLMGGWEKCNGIDGIIETANTTESNENDKNAKDPKLSKGSWDADLRKYIHVSSEDEQRSKSKKKEPTRTSKRKEACTKKTRKKSDDNQDKRTDEDTQKDTKETSDKPTVSESDAQKKPNEVKQASETNTVNNDTEKKPVKKYAQIKTIRTNLKKPENEIVKTPILMESLQNPEFTKSSMDVNQLLHLPDMITLETPRKTEILGVPPTPRLLSPSSNTITPFIKLCEDSSKLRSFISTPEFPTTPCITLTPKLEENTRDNKEMNCSPYFRPSSETEKMKTSQKSPILSKSTERQKLEITQFEVIKENLPKEEAVKELKISSNSRDAFDMRKIEEPNPPVFNECKSNDKLFSESEHSSESDTSSSDTSTSSSSSDSSSQTNASTPCSSAKKRVPSRIYTDSSNESMHKGLEAELQEKANPEDTEKPEIMETESSPAKVFAINKNDEELENTIKETPAKDEALLEADISETPSGSKPGVENLTNLSSKISAFISEDEKKFKSSKKEESRLAKMRDKPKVIDVQRVQSSISLKRAGNYVHTEQRITIDEKLVIQLEEKRQRMIAKFRDVQIPRAPQHSAARGRNRKTMLPIRGRPNRIRRNCVREKYVDKTERKVSEKRQSRDNSTEMKHEEQPSNSKETSDTQTKEKSNEEIQENAETKEKVEEHGAVKEEKVSKPSYMSEEKRILKSKVDQVKRDLFSDEENEQKSARVQAALPEIPEETKQNNTTVNTKEEFAVLQSLQLVPTCKGDQNEENFNVTNDAHFVKYHFVHDDSVPVKKRRRRYSAHDLEFEADVELDGENGKAVKKLMTANEYKEIFNLPPKSKKRLNKRSRTPMIEDKNDGLNFLRNEPLATSSPLIIKTPLAKTKKVKPAVEVKKKSEKTEETQTERKRKASESKECKQTEKKRVTDPRTLLNNLDLDQFLTCVHGPA